MGELEEDKLARPKWQKESLGGCRQADSRKLRCRCGRSSGSHPFKDARLSDLYRDHRAIPSSYWEVHRRSDSLFIHYLSFRQSIGTKTKKKQKKNSAELPAGLIDDGETPEQAAIRELREETGYEAEGVLDSSAVMANDPGMSTSNMKLVVLDVPLNGAMESPDQNLEDGEAIVRRAIEVRNLSKELKEYEKKDYIVDARLSHFAAGFELAERLRTSDIAP